MLFYLLQHLKRNRKGERHKKYAQHTLIFPPAVPSKDALKIKKSGAPLNAINFWAEKLIITLVFDIIDRYYRITNLATR